MDNIVRSLGHFRAEYTVTSTISKSDSRVPAPDPSVVKDPESLTLCEWNIGTQNIDKLPVKFYREDQELFSLQPEYYYVNDPGVIFYRLEDKTLPDNEATLVTIHLKHGELAIYNMKGELIQTTFKDRGIISNLVDLDEWILMFSWQWSPIAFFGIIDKKRFFEDIYKTKGMILSQPTTSGYIPIEQLNELNQTEDGIQQGLQNMWARIQNSINQDPGECNRAGMDVKDDYGDEFYYDKTGIYITNKHLPYDKLYSGELALYEDLEDFESTIEGVKSMLPVV